MKNSEIKKLIEKEGIEVPELGIMVIPQQQFNGKFYEEILKEISEEFIAPYETLQKLRNIAFKSGWKKYSFMKEFWVFVPNPDETSKSNGYVAWFYAYPVRSVLDCGWDPLDSDSGLGVFLYCPITDKAHKK